MKLPLRSGLKAGFAQVQCQRSGGRVGTAFAPVRVGAQVCRFTQRLQGSGQVQRIDTGGFQAVGPLRNSGLLHVGAIQPAQLGCSNAAFVWHHGDQQVDAALFQVALHIDDRLRLVLRIGLRVAIEPEFIGQEQPARTPLTDPRAGVVKQQPACATLDIRCALRQKSP
ncbi:hypothetical protein ALO94_200816 [Pseudomonas syringae pv. spinaceae]|uniref:Uncharacterized protein n=1 Tax=Pseudomonas syringae pv. spinaceae TaxID=264459 RepID=A0A0Q0F399_PSESX|nr:hypothetical protein ALO94_200816 [Pseudomonas syringae pv. spinaceae]